MVAKHAGLDVLQYIASDGGAPVTMKELEKKFRRTHSRASLYRAVAQLVSLGKVVRHGAGPAAYLTTKAHDRTVSEQSQSAQSQLSQQIGFGADIETVIETGATQGKPVVTRPVRPIGFDIETVSGGRIDTVSMQTVSMPPPPEVPPPLTLSSPDTPSLPVVNNNTGLESVSLELTLSPPLLTPPVARSKKQTVSEDTLFGAVAEPEDPKDPVEFRVPYWYKGLTDKTPNYTNLRRSQVDDLEHVYQNIEVRGCLSALISGLAMQKPNCQAHAMRLLMGMLRDRDRDGARKGNRGFINKIPRDRYDDIVGDPFHPEKKGRN